MRFRIPNIQPIYIGAIVAGIFPAIVFLGFIVARDDAHQAELFPFLLPLLLAGLGFMTDPGLGAVFGFVTAFSIYPAIGALIVWMVEKLKSKYVRVLSYSAFIILTYGTIIHFIATELHAKYQTKYPTLAFCLKMETSQERYNCYEHFYNLNEITLEACNNLELSDYTNRCGELLGKRNKDVETCIKLKTDSAIVACLNAVNALPDRECESTVECAIEFSRSRVNSQQ